ncbi:MAG: hypothetical protein SFY96_01155 [Planctomycetota bacterium]|nr:hypothetical protein [Planctomycetota bacterium]
MPRRKVSTTAIATIEFWARRAPSERLLNRIGAARPRVFIRPEEAWAALRLRRPRRKNAPQWMCRFELCRQTVSKTRPFVVLSEWANENQSLIRAARREGVDVVAAIEVFNRYVLYNLPIDAASISALARGGIRLTICVQSASAE